MPSKSTLFRQTISSLKKFLGTHVGCVGDGEEDWANVTVGMIKSVYNAWRQGRLPRFDLLVIDECHNVSKLDGQYAELLNNLPVRRYGVTATPQKKLELKDLPEPFVVMRSCLGRMVGEITEEELMQDGFIARPRMKFLRVPINHKVKQLNAWTDVYEYGVVRNPNALQAISREVLHQVVDKHRTVLIMVQRIRHLLNIEHTLRKQNPKLRIGLALGGPDAELVREIENCKKRIQAVRARKSSELTAKLEADLLKSIESMRSVKAHLIAVSKTQAQVVEALNDRKLDIAIASPAWNQGIDIPTLDVVLNAGGLKSEIITVQIGGRGMTIADGKSDYLLIDIFDASHHHLVSHFGERICIYSKRGWL